MLVVAVSLSVALAGVVPAVGQTKPVEDEIKAIKDDAGLASVEEAKLVNLVQAAEGRQKELEAKVAAANKQVRKVQNDLSTARGNLTTLEARKRTLDARLVETNQHLADTKSRRVQLALDAYTGRSSALGYAASILDAQDLGALAARRSYEHVVGESQSEAAAKEEDLRDEVTDLLEELDGVRRQMEVKRAGLGGQAAQIEKQQQVRTGLIQQAEAEVAEHTRLVNEATARRAEFEGQLAELEAQSNAVEASLRERQGDTAAPEGQSSSSSSSSASTGGGRFGHPLPGHRLGSPLRSTGAPDLRLGADAHRGRHRRHHRHADPRRRGRHRRQRRRDGWLRERHGDRPRRRGRHPLRPPEQHRGLSRPEGHPRPGDREGRLHRHLSGRPPSLRGPPERATREPGALRHLTRLIRRGYRSPTA